MIPYMFMKGETDEEIKNAVDRFRVLNHFKRSREARNVLKHWCEKYLPKKDGKPRTYDDVVTAKPDELKELKEYMYEHRTEFIQYNKELHIDAYSGIRNKSKEHYASAVCITK